MNSNDTPPARDRGEPAQSENSAAHPLPGQVSAASAVPSSSVPNRTGEHSSVSTGPLAQPGGPDRPGAPVVQHRVASGLPPQPPPTGSAKGAIRPDPSPLFAAKGGLGLNPPISGLAKEASAAGTATPAQGADTAPPTAATGTARTDLP